MSLLLLGVSNDVTGAPSTYRILAETGDNLAAENSDLLIQE